MDAAQDLARAGPVRFKLDCVDRRDIREGKACDGLAALKAVDLKKIRFVDELSEDLGEESETHVDRVSVGEGLADQDHPELVTFTITSRRTYANDGKDQVLAVAVERQYG